MTKLLVSIGTLSSGGAERVLSILSHQFIANYDEVIYLTWIDAPDFYQINCNVKRVCVERECKSKSLFNKLLWFRKYIRRENPTVILSFLAPFNVLVSFALMGMQKKLIVAERNDPRAVWNGVFQRILRNIAYRMADGILEQTDNNKSYFSGSLLAKTEVIYNPIIMPNEYVASAIFTEKQKSIVSVARLTSQKNLEMLIFAFKKFHRHHPEYSLTIYGEGPSRISLELMIKELGLNDFVSLPGAVNNVWDKIKDAECFVLSSLYEGMPNALLEAMCLGLPCISTKVSGAVDLIISGENGILVDVNDCNALCNAFCEVVQNRELQIKLGSNASSLYNLLNYDVISKQWIEYINKIIIK